jgi:glycosyltransferase involved in cell wall biosynthesis
MVKPLVSVVVPAYNEADIIENSLAKLCQYMESLEDQYRWEMIIVNDGSTDRTGDLAETFAATRDNVHVLHHIYNFRLGQALRYAFSDCRGDYVVVMDVDLSYSPEHIGSMLAKIIESRAKIVIASPYMKGGRLSNVPWLRKILSIWANRFLSFIITKDAFSDRLTTLTGMVRTYDGKFLSRLNLKSMDVDIHSEIIYKAMVLRARIVEIPAHLDWRYQNNGGKQRQSSMRIFKSTTTNLICGFMFRPFMFFIMPGFFLMLLSFYPILWAFVHSYNQLRTVSLSSSPTIDFGLSEAIGAAFHQSPHAFIVGGFALMIAIQLISLGLLALQKKRYFEELFHLGSSNLKK